MSSEVEYTDDFEVWWNSLDSDEPASVKAHVELLMELGARLPFPYGSGIEGSRHSHMRELRVQHKGEPYRVLYAFDPRRVAILLIGGRKTGNERWYRENIPRADRIYDAHLKSIERQKV